MLQIDLHSHTNFSACGVHTVIEMLTAAKQRGLAALAVTDHGPAQNGKTPGPFFDRCFNPVPGIKLLKGRECNVIDQEGSIDINQGLLKHMDIVLLGLHANVKTFFNGDNFTALLLKAMENNPCVDIITHLNNADFTTDFDQIAARAASLGIAIEINNSKTNLKRIDDETTRRLISTCLKHTCLIAVNSDAHTVNEIGTDEAVRPFLAEAGYPEQLIINRSLKSGMDFIETRRKNKN